MFRFLIFVATMAKGKPRYAARHFLETTTSNDNYLGSLMADAASESMILVRNPDEGDDYEASRKEEMLLAFFARCHWLFTEKMCSIRHRLRTCF